MPHHEQFQHGLPPHGESTGASDVTYGLTSVLYHPLQGAETYAAYMDDAERLGDQEAARFFQGAQQEEMRRADRAKGLLRARIG